MRTETYADYFRPIVVAHTFGVSEGADLVEKQPDVGLHGTGHRATHQPPDVPTTRPDRQRHLEPFADLDVIQREFKVIDV